MGFEIARTSSVKCKSGQRLFFSNAVQKENHNWYPDSYKCDNKSEASEILLHIQDWIPVESGKIKYLPVECFLTAYFRIIPNSNIAFNTRATCIYVHRPDCRFEPHHEQNSFCNLRSFKFDFSRGNQQPPLFRVNSFFSRCNNMPTNAIHRNCESFKASLSDFYFHSSCFRSCQNFFVGCTKRIC